MDFAYSARVEDLRGRLSAFMEREILPANRRWLELAESGTYPLEVVEPLKAKARAEGLWNLFLPGLRPDEPGTRLSNLEYAPLAEQMGRVPAAQAPSAARRRQPQALRGPGNSAPLAARGRMCSAAHQDGQVPDNELRAHANELLAAETNRSLFGDEPTPPTPEESSEALAFKSTIEKVAAMFRAGIQDNQVVAAKRIDRSRAD